ncbi:MAG: prephenate dehydrogenase [Clostridia bacterium]|nr:prephenate dehydrogenase [Clostridia bacterium]
MNIVIVGLGIIGGSLAKAFVKYTNNHIIGINRTHSTLEKALSEGSIHEIGTTDCLKDADVVFMCTYPDHISEFVKDNAEKFKKDCVITDVCGIKSKLCEKMTEICSEYGLTFCGSHPMAGKEKFSYDAADAELFQGASYIIVPCGAPQSAVDLLSDLAKQIGFTQIRITTPSEHDRMIAFTSQLPHVLACSYVKSPCCPNHKGFSAGSYRDVSRVASINENLWTDLFLDNKEPLCEEISILINNLEQFKELISNGEKEQLREELKKARLIKHTLGE